MFHCAQNFDCDGSVRVKVRACTHMHTPLYSSDDAQGISERLADTIFKSWAEIQLFLTKRSTGTKTNSDSNTEVVMSLFVATRTPHMLPAQALLPLIFA